MTPDLQPREERRWWLSRSRDEPFWTVAPDAKVAAHLKRAGWEVVEVVPVPVAADTEPEADER